VNLLSRPRFYRDGGAPTKDPWLRAPRKEVAVERSPLCPETVAGGGTIEVLPASHDFPLGCARQAGSGLAHRRHRPGEVYRWNIGVKRSNLDRIEGRIRMRRALAIG